MTLSGSLRSSFGFLHMGCEMGIGEPKLPPFMVSRGLCRMIYSSEVPSLLQTQHWGKWEGRTKYWDLAQAKFPLALAIYCGPL